MLNASMNRFCRIGIIFKCCNIILSFCIFSSCTTTKHFAYESLEASVPLVSLYSKALLSISKKYGSTDNTRFLRTWSSHPEETGKETWYFEFLHPNLRGKMDSFAIYINVDGIVEKKRQMELPVLAEYTPPPPPDLYDFIKVMVDNSIDIKNVNRIEWTELGADTNGWAIEMSNSKTNLFLPREYETSKYEGNNLKKSGLGNHSWPFFNQIQEINVKGDAVTLSLKNCDEKIYFSHNEMARINPNYLWDSLWDSIPVYFESAESLIELHRQSSRSIVDTAAEALAHNDYFDVWRWYVLNADEKYKIVKRLSPAECRKLIALMHKRIEEYKEVPKTTIPSCLYLGLADYLTNQLSSDFKIEFANVEILNDIENKEKTYTVNLRILRKSQLNNKEFESYPWVIFPYDSLFSIKPMLFLMSKDSSVPTAIASSMDKLIIEEFSSTAGEMKLKVQLPNFNDKQLVANTYVLIYIPYTGIVKVDTETFLKHPPKQ